jgi:hypothetical protein
MLIIMALGAGCTSTATCQSCSEAVAATQAPTNYVPNVDYLEISPAYIDNARIGETRQFTATAYDEHNNVLSVKVKWRVSSGTSRANIDSRGKLTLRATGEVEVTASAGGQSAIAYVNVKKSSTYRSSSYQSSRYDDDDDDDDYNEDNNYGLPPDHCYYRNDATEAAAAKMVPCNR